MNEDNPLTIYLIGNMIGSNKTYILNTCNNIIILVKDIKTYILLFPLKRKA